MNILGEKNILCLGTIITQRGSGSRWKGDETERVRGRAEEEEGQVEREDRGRRDRRGRKRGKVGWGESGREKHTAGFKPRLSGKP